MKRLLEIKGLTVEFKTERGTLRAVDGVSYGVDSGKTLGVVGESGCGKSVTALSLLRLLPSPQSRISAQSIWFEEQELLNLSVDEMRSLRGRRMAMIFQEPMTCLNPVLTVGFQIGEAISAHEPGVNKKELKERVIELLGHVGIPEPESRYQSYPHELSGGMRQRVMIAMALSCRPRLLIADEPTTALDVTIQAQILELIQRLQNETGMSVLLISHDLGVISEMADEVVVMYAGKVVEHAPASELFKNPLHPYTKGLLASLPSVDSEGSDKAPLRGIPGMVPSPLNFPSGCRFSDRCEWVQSRCRSEEPRLEKKRDSHDVSCFEVK